MHDPKHGERETGRVLVAGSLAYDVVMDFPGRFQDHILPDKLHIINLSFLVDKMNRQRGGCAGNIGYTLALLGERPRLVASAGHDFPPYRDFLESKGVDTSFVAVHPDEVTATCNITTDRANNQITGFYVGAMSRARELSLAEAATPATRFAVVAPDDPAAMERHAAEARQAGIPLIYDPSFQVIALSGEQLLRGADGARALILNDYEFAVFQEKTGQSLEALLTRIELIVVTLGERGSRIHTRAGDTLEIPACRLAQVADPTGAGDAYRAGFLFGLLHDEDLVSCARRGSVAAAYAVENHGTQTFDYTLEEYGQRYLDNYGVRPGAGAALAR